MDHCLDKMKKYHKKSHTKIDKATSIEAMIAWLFGRALEPAVKAIARRLTVFASLALIVSAHAEEIDTFPAYRAEQQVTGVIRTWGHGSLEQDFIGGLVRTWETGFRKHQPGISFDTTLRGDASAIGGLYTGSADIALMERGPTAIELDAYQPIFKHDPFEISVATGSLDVPNHCTALVVFVNQANPLAKLTLTQLDAIIGADHRRGSKNIRTWGELGLTGEWADKPINTYVSSIAQDASQFLEKAVMGGSQKWTGNLRELSDMRRPGGAIAEAGQRIVDALTTDRYGIAVSSLLYKNPRVKPLALAPTDGGPYYEATRETVAQRTYPLARTVSVFINRAPGQPIDPKVKEYLRYILSKEGQDDIARDGGYFPLRPDVAQQEWKKLK
jgi:phosphate transport system substrate-binding protein